MSDSSQNSTLGIARSSTSQRHQDRRLDVDSTDDEETARLHLRLHVRQDNMSIHAYQLPLRQKDLTASHLCSANNSHGDV